MEILTYGEAALLVELPSLDAVLELYTALNDDRPTGIADLIPAARTLLVVLADGSDPNEIFAALRVRAERARALVPSSAPDSTVHLEVIYDGEDLETLARATNLSTTEVVDRHAAADYRVAFCGFVPGFAYLEGLDPVLHAPRQSTPRRAVPAGSVGVASEYTAIYPRASPGGWNIVGRTETPLFDVDRDPPALLSPNTRVRFHARKQ